MDDIMSVEKVFFESMVEEVVDEAYEASIYGDAIDSIAGLSPIDDSVKRYTDNVTADPYSEDCTFEQMTADDMEILDEIEREATREPDWFEKEDDTYDCYGI